MPKRDRGPSNAPAQVTVTGLITVFNAEDAVRDALESLLAQSFDSFEVLVVDDGSTDRTAEILDTFRDPRLRVHRAGRIGRAAALSLGVHLARGEFVAILDADDTARRDRFALQAAFLHENPRVAWLGCAERRVDARRRETAVRRYPLEDRAIRRMAARCIPYPHSGVMFRREIAEQGLGYDPSARFLIDFDLFLRVAERHKVANLPDALVTRHLHSDSFFERSFSRGKQNRMLSRLCLSAVWRLRLPPTHALYPLTRLVYDLFPDRAKRRLRRWAGLQESFDPA